MKLSLRQRALSLRAQLFGGFGLMIVLTIVCGGTSVVLSSRAADATRGVLEGPVAERMAAERARAALFEARQVERAFLLERDPAMVERFDQAVASVEQELDHLASLERGDYWAPKVKNAKEHLHQYGGLFHGVSDLMVARGLTEKQGLEGELRAAVHSVEEALADSGHDELTVLMLMCRRHEKDYLMRGNRKKYIGRIATRLSEFEAAVAELEVSPEQRAAWAANWKTYYETINRLADVQDDIDATIEQFGVATDHVETDLEHILADAPEAAADLNSMLAGAQRVSMGMLAAATLLGVLMAWLLVRSIARPIRAIAEMAHKLAEGDLNVEGIELHSQDELSYLAGSMVSMRDSLRGVVSAIREAASDVRSAASEVSSSAEETVSGMDHQSKLMEQVSAAAVEMSSSADEVAKKSVEASEHATASGELANDGSRVVESTIQGMLQIDEAVGQGSESVQQLGARSEEIGAVIAVINDIADQTNLLALNAAIEAARAGEHGRGFAVVADEVRKLADRTTEATKEVEESITAIRLDTERAVQRMREGTECVSAGRAHTTAAGESLGKIRSFAVELEDMVRSIAAAAGQQSSASADVSRTIQEISSVTHQAVESARVSSNAMNDLAGRADGLVELVSRFRL